MNIKQTILGAALVLASSGASAGFITVGGVTWNPDDLTNDYFSTDTIYESLVTTPGDVLGGYGKITVINGESTFCPGCELTYQFGGYVLDSILDLNGNSTFGDVGDEVVFTGGWANFYVDNTPDFNNGVTGFASAGAGGSSENPLWLSLVGHSQTASFSSGAVTAVGTLFGSLTVGSLGTGTEGGNGFGNLDATGGVALWNFNTNTKAGGSDLALTSQFQPRACAGVCPGAYELTGGNTMSGNTIPEPTSLALLGMGLLGFGANRVRKQA